jgi:DNA-binding transcriptional regulator GbsR (MarR family)
MISKRFCAHTHLPITEEQLQLVEKLGVMFEGPGLQPAAARITALLIVADKVELSFDEIRETLKLSKSATSNAVNLLLNVKRIDYITKPGDRKRYFRSDIAHWKDGMNEKFKEMAKLSFVLKEVLSQRPDSTPDFNENLSEMISLFEYIFKEIPGLFKAWEETNEKSS